MGKRKILHITAHMGGGVGRVVKSLIDCLGNVSDQYTHEIASFEYINEASLAWAEKRSIFYQQNVSPTSPDFHRQVREADLVHLHFWNHPATYHFLSAFSGQIARLLMWSHVNGHHAPYKFSRDLLEYPELFVVASPYSLHTPEIKSLELDYRHRHIRCIFSTAGTAPFDRIRPAPHDDFHVGYVGTVDYAKLHPDFLGICARINVPRIKFIVCGGHGHREMERQAEANGWGNLFDFRGPVDNVPEALAGFDVFGYPLGTGHYGTGEQVLIEAMAAGVPQVVLDNGPERYVVKDGTTGIVAHDLETYAEAVEELYGNPDLRTAMSNGSRDYARRVFSIESAAKQWLDLYDELCSRDKRTCGFKSDHFPEMDNPRMPVNLFLAALGHCPEADLFRELLDGFPANTNGRAKGRIAALAPIFKSQTRGSAAHYSRYFKDSAELDFLKQLTQGDMPEKDDK